MKLDAVLHIPMSEYAYGLDETHIVYKLRCAKGDLKKVTLYYGDTACRVTPITFFPVKMDIVASDKLHDYWQVIVDSKYNRVYYYFDIDDGTKSVYYYGYLFTDKLVDDRSQYFKMPINHRADIAKVPSWVEDAVVYNIFPDSFATSRKHISCKAQSFDYNGNKVTSRLGGTLQGVADNVDYLTQLGVNCVYVNPIFVAGEYHKYDLLDYYHVDPCFGGDVAFKNMVDRLHAKGIKVIIDGVFNHCGWHFFAFEDVVKNQQNSKYCDWFYGLKFPVVRPDNPEDYPTYTTFAYERLMPKLATDNPTVQQYFCDVGRYWIKQFDIDGWRLDVASEVNSEFWRSFRRAVKEEKPEALLIGEVWETANYWLLGDMFDSAMNYDFRKHSELFFAKSCIDAEEFAGRVTHMLTRYKLNVLPAQLNLLDSHDVGRFLSLCNEDVRRFKLAVLFMMSFVGMPTIFYGDEQGVVGTKESDYRASMPWDNPNDELFEFFKKAIAIRKTCKPLKKGDFKVISAQKDSQLFAYSRTYNGESVIAYLNAGENFVQLDKIQGELLWQNGLCDKGLYGFGFCLCIDKR